MFITSWLKHCFVRKWKTKWYTAAIVTCISWACIDDIDNETQGKSQNQRSTVPGF